MHTADRLDCYPYAAGSSTLDLRQVDERRQHYDYLERAAIGDRWQSLQEIAEGWGVTQLEAARALRRRELFITDLRRRYARILAHPATMIGSDGLPNDPRPHPRLWGTFPRVLGRYSREEQVNNSGDARA